MRCPGLSGGDGSNRAVVDTNWISGGFSIFLIFFHIYQSLFSVCGYLIVGLSGYDVVLTVFP